MIRINCLKIIISHPVRATLFCLLVITTPVLTHAEPIRLTGSATVTDAGGKTHTVQLIGFTFVHDKIAEITSKWHYVEAGSYPFMDTQRIRFSAIGHAYTRDSSNRHLQNIMCITNLSESFCYLMNESDWLELMIGHFFEQLDELSKMNPETPDYQELLAAINKPVSGCNIFSVYLPLNVLIPSALEGDYDYTIMPDAENRSIELHILMPGDHTRIIHISENEAHNIVVSYTEDNTEWRFELPQNDMWLCGSENSPEREDGAHALPPRDSLVSYEISLPSFSNIK